MANTAQTLPSHVYQRSQQTHAAIAQVARSLAALVDAANNPRMHPGSVLSQAVIVDTNLMHVRNALRAEARELEAERVRVPEESAVHA